MQDEFIQLPPIPKDEPGEFVELVWLFAKLRAEERETVLDFVKSAADGAPGKIMVTEYAKILKNISLKASPDIQEFTELTRRLLGHLFAQACDMAATVYLNCIVAGKPVKETSGELALDEDLTRMIAAYYQKKAQK